MNDEDEYSYLTERRRTMPPSNFSYMAAIRYHIRMFLRRRTTRRLLLLIIFIFLLFQSGDILSSWFSDDNDVPKHVLHHIHTTTAYKTQTRTVVQPANPLFHKPAFEGQERVTHAENQKSDHYYSPDGLLHLNPEGLHPIYELIERGERRWAKKLAGASKTLEQAIKEYQRRYKRAPPLGFDEWWYYVEAHNVQLPDEYDQIYRDMEPLWGMDPKALAAIQAEWEGHADSYTVGKAMNQPISLLNYTLPGGIPEERFELTYGAFELIKLLKDVQDFIPPFRAVFSPHDNPSLPIDHELKTMAIEAAAAGKYIDINKPPPVKIHGWLSSCPPLSPAWADPIEWKTVPPPRQNKTFIHDHMPTMDPCLHPNLLILHGEFLSHLTGGTPHRKIIPQFSYSPTLVHHDIITSMPINWVEDIDDLLWEEKPDDRCLWRGSNTGMWASPTTMWKSAQRLRLVDWANSRTGTERVLPSPTDPKEKVGSGVEHERAQLHAETYDVHFTGEPLSCAPEQCKELATMFKYGSSMNFEKAGAYKYVLDFDGNGWSSRFKRLITSHSLVLKATVYPEWFTERIEPWVHFVPVNIDLSDINDVLAFFRGEGPNRTGAHDDLARRIALSGRKWSKTFWRKEDLTAYMFRLFLEYARVMSETRESLPV